MDRLRYLRSNWQEIEAASAQVSDTTAIERVEQLVSMYRAFKPEIEATEEIFGPERRAALIELQARLAKLKK